MLIIKKHGCRICFLWNSKCRMTRQRMCRPQLYDFYLFVVDFKLKKVRSWTRVNKQSRGWSSFFFTVYRAVMVYKSDSFIHFLILSLFSFRFLSLYRIFFFFLNLSRDLVSLLTFRFVAPISKYSALTEMISASVVLSLVFCQSWAVAVSTST